MEGILDILRDPTLMRRIKKKAEAEVAAGPGQGADERTAARPRPLPVSDQPFEVTWMPTARRDVQRLPEKVVMEPAASRGAMLPRRRSRPSFGTGLAPAVTEATRRAYHRNPRKMPPGPALAA